jgi:hypothetical protein
MEEKHRWGLNGWSYYKVSISVFWLLSISTFIGVIYYGWKVYKKYRFTNCGILIFLCSLLLATLCDIIFCWAEIFMRYSDWSPVSQWFTLFSSWINFIFYMLSMLIWAFNWWLNILRLQNHIEQNVQKISWIITSTLISISLIAYIFFLGRDWIISSDSNDLVPGVAIMFGIMYNLLAIAFAVLSIIFLRKLKRKSVDIYNSLFWRVVAYSSVVSVLFFIRGLYILSRSFKDYITEFKENSLINKDIGYPIFILLYYFCVSILPTLFHILMLRSLWKYAYFVEISVDSKVYSGFMSSYSQA